MRYDWQRHKKTLIKRLIIALGLIGFSLYGYTLSEVTYNLSAPTPLAQSATPVPNQSKSSPFTLALLTDLHGCYYGENQHDLVDRLKRQRPDVILLGGDIYDDRLPFTHTDRLLSQLSAIAPTFYVDGNHEWWLPTETRLQTLQKLASYHIRPIMGEQIVIANTRIRLFGLSDPESGQFATQLQRLGHQAQPENFNILLSHRPEYIHEYLQYPFDLVLSGHAHGGQWRIPLIMNGLIAPNQGLFPKYAGGLYQFNGHFGGQPKTTTFIVSRGLARESTKVPRFFNHPELVFIKIL